MGSGNKKKQRMARRRRRQEQHQLDVIHTNMEVDTPNTIVNHSINMNLSDYKIESENNMINEYIVISKDDVENNYNPNYEPVKSKKFYHYFV